MTQNESVTKFLELLDVIQDNCKLFESMVLSTEILSEFPIEDAQIVMVNCYLEKAQEEWSDSFIEVLELTIEWLKKNKR